MNNRRDGREATVQFLFNRDVNADLNVDQLEEFFIFRRAKGEAKRYATHLIRGICEKLTEIDDLVRPNLENFTLDRLATVDRAILRMAVFEMKFDTEVPRAVVINEAIEVARRLSTEDSARFVHGVLDAIP